MHILTCKQGHSSIVYRHFAVELFLNPQFGLHERGARMQPTDCQGVYVQHCKFQGVYIITMINCHCFSEIFFNSISTSICCPISTMNASLRTNQVHTMLRTYVTTTFPYCKVIMTHIGSTIVWHLQPTTFHVFLGHFKAVPAYCYNRTHRCVHLFF